MTHRQATIWRKKIQDAENVKSFDRAYTVKVIDPSTNDTTSFLNIYDTLSGEHYQLYTAEEARLWLNDKY